MLSKWSTVIVYVVLKIKNDTFSLKTENRNCLLFETAKRKKKKKKKTDLHGATNLLLLYLGG